MRTGFHSCHSAARPIYLNKILEFTKCTAGAKEPALLASGPALVIFRLLAPQSLMTRNRIGRGGFPRRGREPCQTYSTYERGGIGFIFCRSGFQLHKMPTEGIAASNHTGLPGGLIHSFQTGPLTDSTSPFDKAPQRGTLGVL